MKSSIHNETLKELDATYKKFLKKYSEIILIAFGSHFVASRESINAYIKYAE